MAKGKKFDAAQAHFHIKERKLKQEISHLTSKCNDLKRDNHILQVNSNMLLGKVADLNKELETLRELVGLTPEEVKSLVRNAKGTEMLSGLFSSLGNNSPIGAFKALQGLAHD